MAPIDPSMRPKVKGDTFYLTGTDGSVYFRNNEGSFRMEGNSIAQWIEKLIPAFDGKQTVEELTEGLPDHVRERVVEIAEILYRNGFVRDESQDQPHDLTDEILNRYASQIEFLDSFGGSGAARFASYRQDKVLAIGSGPMFVSLVSALLESGLPKFNVLITDTVPTSRERLAELAAQAKKFDPEVEVLETQGGSWREVVRSFDWVLYVSQDADVEELLALQAACREEKKALFPAVCLKQAGLAGPLVHPDGEGCWESVLHRIHESAVCKDPQVHTFSSTAGALLANLAVYERFKTSTGVSPLQNTFFLLNLETLEGNWHWFLPHPKVTGLADVHEVEDFEQKLEWGAGRSDLDRYFLYFSWLTSKEAGVFQLWEEGDLQQLPLALCRVQAVDPCSAGHAEVQPDMVCSGLTHHEARFQAGFSGLESYVTRLIGEASQEFVGIGTGGTVAEAIGRGLEKCLANELFKQQQDLPPRIRPVELLQVEDELCSYYLQTLTTIQGEPFIGVGQDVCGFPVVWIRTGGRWYGSAGLNLTLALEKALQQALVHIQAPAQVSSLSELVVELPAVTMGGEEPLQLVIPDCAAQTPASMVQTALQVLQGQGKRLAVFDLALEPFLREVVAGVYGVVLREEESL